MSIENVFESGEIEDIYKFKKAGSFGRFSTINNFPIEFFLTTLTANQLKDLTFARDIKPASIDFEQLLQRDIDEDRIREEIEPYLTSPDLTDAEKRSKTIFFPPLLVAAVPVENKTMLEYYPKQEITADDKFLYREWNEHFKLKIQKVKTGYKIKPSMLSETDYIINKEPVVFEAKLSDGKELGINLIVIDGQHRLKALQEVYNSSTSDLSELAIPICILFSPNSTQEVAQQLNDQSFSTPTVSQIFRQLFVDVNKNAVSVGGHFNILLSEGNIGSSICREFCKHTLEKRKMEGLAQIEWNQKNRKLSTEISKQYYLTSIGVLDKAFSESFSRSKNIFNYLINFSEIEKLVHPNVSEEDYYDYPIVSWERFSLSQKIFIEQQIKKSIVPILDKLFFESKLFKPTRDSFVKKINEIQKLVKTEIKNSHIYESVLDKILSYTPISSDISMRAALGNYRKFEEDIAEEKQATSFILAGHAIFQRALIFSFHEFLKASRNSRLEATIASEIYLIYLDLIVDELKLLISSNNIYCQSFIFLANRVNPTADVRKGLGYLILSGFSNKTIREKIESHLNLLETNCNINFVLEEYENLSYRSINSYFELYVKNKNRDFKSTYQIDRSLSPDEIEQLLYLETIKKKDEKAFKDGLIAKIDINTDFDDLISLHVKKETEKAQEQLRQNLKLELDIFGLDGIFSNSENFIYTDIED